MNAERAPNQKTLLGKHDSDDAGNRASYFRETTAVFAPGFDELRHSAPLSQPAVRLRDFHPSHRLWLVGPVQHLFPYPGPVLLQVPERAPTVMPSIPGLALTRL
jgi:hypothetical protein